MHLISYLSTSCLLLFTIFFHHTVKCVHAVVTGYAITIIQLWRTERLIHILSNKWLIEYTQWIIHLLTESLQHSCLDVLRLVCRTVQFLEFLGGFQLFSHEFVYCCWFHSFLDVTMEASDLKKPLFTTVKALFCRHTEIWEDFVYTLDGFSAKISISDKCRKVILDPIKDFCISRYGFRHFGQLS